MTAAVIAFSAGALAALVGSMSGGGAGVIQLAGLLAVGLPVNSAVATHIFGDLGFYRRRCATSISEATSNRKQASEEAQRKRYEENARHREESRQRHQEERLTELKY